MIRSKLEQREICNHRLSDCNDRLPAARMQQRQIVASAVNAVRDTDENSGGSHHAKASRPLNALSNDSSRAIFCAAPDKPDMWRFLDIGGGVIIE